MIASIYLIGKGSAGMVTFPSFYKHELGFMCLTDYLPRPEHAKNELLTLHGSDGNWFFEILKTQCLFSLSTAVS